MVLVVDEKNVLGFEIGVYQVEVVQDYRNGQQVAAIEGDKTTYMQHW